MTLKSIFLPFPASFCRFLGLRVRIPSRILVILYFFFLVVVVVGHTLTRLVHRLDKNVLKKVFFIPSFHQVIDVSSTIRNYFISNWLKNGTSSKIKAGDQTTAALTIPEGAAALSETLPASPLV